MSLAPSPSRPLTLSPSWRRLAAPLMVVGVIGGAVVWDGADREPSKATTPVTLRGELRPPSSARRSIRIGTFNIHGGRGPGGEVDLAATAAVLKSTDIDFVCLNEVRGTFGGDQAGELGGRLEMASLFGGTERRWWHDHFGNGLLTRRPLRSALRIPLPGTQSKRFRNAILTTIDVGGTPTRVLATHIDTEVDRERQLAAVFELFRSLEAPVMLMGDLNSTADHPAVAALLAEPGVVDAIAAKLGPASRVGRIDHLLVRGLAVLDAGVVETPASDHPYVWAELAVP